MISRYSRCASAPQESLKQFSLNTSKGIDNTKPITDSDTVLSMENLVVNPDGSVSLRKPMVATSTTVGEKIHVMHDGEHVFKYSGDCCILRRGGAVYQSWKLICNNYYTNAESVVTTGKVFNNAEIDFSNASFFNVPGATVAGNCFVSASLLSSAGAIDPSLYDADVIENKLPRYIKFFKEPVEDVWTVAIINPELNQLNFAEGEIPLNPNMCLDNPYAIRDGYGNAIPSVKGIIPYILQNASEVPSSETATRTLEASSKSIPRVFDGTDEYYKHYLNFSINTSQPWGEFLNISPYPGASVRLKAYVEEVDGTTQGKVTATFTNFSGILKILLDVYPIDELTGEIVNNYVGGQWLTFKESATVDVDIHLLSNPHQAFHYHVVRWNYTLVWNVRDLSENVKTMRVSQITESCRADAVYRPCATLKAGTPIDWIILKAFCNLPEMSDMFYVTWDYSFDGVRWNPIGAHTFTEFPGQVYVRVLDEEWKPSENVKEPSETDYVIRTYVPLRASAANDYVASGPSSRPDVLPLHLFKTELSSNLESALFRFSIATLKESNTVSDTTVYEIVATVSQSQFTLTPGVNTTYLETDAPNAVLGEKFYYKKAIYSFGTEDYKSLVHVSDVGSFVTPMYNVIDLDAYSDDIVTAIVPWRDYLLVCTERAIYLSAKSSNGFYTKTVSTSVGVPLKDRNSVVSALNGILFKHGPSVYLAYPNLYASDDSILMLTDISKQVSHILESSNAETSFATYHDDSYVLMLPESDSLTRCLVYDVGEKRWAHLTYPVKFYTFFNFSDGVGATLTAADTQFEYLIFRDASLINGYVDNLHDMHMDVLDRAWSTCPIHFEFDTGQKTDSVLHTKQFVESKFTFATLSERDAFPLTVHVAIDGDARVTKTDITTDAPFWKNSEGTARGVVGTAFRLGGTSTPATGAFNTLRQLVIRHSGKGKSIRYVLEGDSMCNFKLYETYVRYKNLNVKQ